jgi:uncharacterized protein (DUF488 family)
VTAGGGLYLSRLAVIIHFPAMTLYSIGHSNAAVEAFIELLRRHEIELLADTRSQPYSRYSPQFSRDALKQSLNEAGVAYVFMGEALGGRPAGEEFYLPSGKVDYDLLAAAPFYLSGVERLLEFAAECRVAFMCSEADYTHCHRYHLITRTLLGRGVEVKHILHSGDLAASCLEEFVPAQPSLF